MRLFRSSIRPPAVLSDEAVDRYLRALRRHVEPDPFFRRRLRGQVLNRYVANREGTRGAAAAGRQMGRLGRAVLYASFVLGLSVSSVMAASQEAIPGDPLYALKRQVESLRAEVAPAHLQDDLAAYALAERIQELGTLADRGAWDAVADLAVEVRHDYAAVVASGRGTAATSYLDAIDRLVEGLPAHARAQVAVLLDGGDGGRGTATGRGDAGTADGDGPPDGSASARGDAGADVGSRGSDRGGAAGAPTGSVSRPGGDRVTGHPTAAPMATAEPAPASSGAGATRADRTAKPRPTPPTAPGAPSSTAH